MLTEVSVNRGIHNLVFILFNSNYPKDPSYLTVRNNRAGSFVVNFNHDKCSLCHKSNINYFSGFSIVRFRFRTPDGCTIQISNA